MRFLREFQTVLTVLCGITLAVSLTGLHPALPYWSVAFGSYFALKSAYLSLRDRSVDVNFLMVLAAAGAVAVGHPVEAAVLLFLFSLSSTLESFAMSRTRSAIEGLIRLRPDRALRVSKTGDESVELAELKAGDSVRILPFDQVPADGRVVSGTSSINAAAMTGESIPVAVAPGDRVLAGTQNLEGMLVVSVSAAVGETTLEKIVQLVRETQENKASGERISAWFGQRYTFFVVAAFSVALAVRLTLGEAVGPALYSALTLLVALSPCALVISTPASTLSALAWAARNGMLVRGGEYIELTAGIDTLCVDKTGTLTTGRPELRDLCVCAPALVRADAACPEEGACWHGGLISSDAAQALRLAASAEQYSTHPIAEAIVRAARDLGLDVPEATEHQAHAGLGVTATVEGVRVRIGQRKFFEGQMPAAFEEHVVSMQHRGQTVAVMEHGGTFSALGLNDQIRPEAREALATLRSLGISRVVLLTGDTPQTAEAVARELGITQVHAGLMPQEKTEILRAEVAAGRKVMMVGDGINDAPSLAAATVGVAMGGLGSDVALNAADVVLMRDRLTAIPELVQLGRRTRGIIRANLFFAGAVIGGLTLMALLFGQLAPGHYNLVLPLAVVGHEGSTVLVILNGLRLLRGYK